jgi:hypothetical protein
MLVATHGMIRFRHELARRVVELSLPASRRVDYHRRVLEALVAAGPEPSRLVHHAVAAGDDQAVARYAAAAASQAATRRVTARWPPSPGWPWSGASSSTGPRWLACTG